MLKVWVCVCECVLRPVKFMTTHELFPVMMIDYHLTNVSSQPIRLAKRQESRATKVGQHLPLNSLEPY